MNFSPRIETSRLQLRWLDLDDAPFILELVNDDGWLRYIGDKGVGSIDDARRYLETGPITMYREHGFGLNRVALKRDDRAIGICGILQRENLGDVDLGFALLPAYRRQGYAREAAAAVLEQAFASGISRVCAFLDPDNLESRRLLQDLGFSFETRYRPEPEANPLDLYGITR